METQEQYTKQNKAKEGKKKESGGQTQLQRWKSTKQKSTRALFCQ
jgi:hypothetical protein